MRVPFQFPCGNARGIPYSAKCQPGSVIRGLASKMFERSDKPIVFPAPLHEEQAKRGGPERRVHVRFPFTAAAEVHELPSQTRVTGRCSDLSPGGCYVDTLSPFVVGSAVRVHIERESREFEAAAIVT
jgi:PilZ domain